MYNIAFVSNTSWSIYNFRLGVIKFLLASGYNVVVIAPEDEYSLKLKDIGCAVYSLNIDNYGTNPLRDIKTIIRIAGLYRSIRPNLVFHYTIKPNLYGILVAYFKGIPSVAVTTGLGHSFYRNFFTSIITKYLYRLAGSLCNEMWFLNQQDLDDFLKINIISEKKALLLNSEGVNTTYFKPVDSAEIKEKTIFLYAGRLIKDKGIQFLIDAANMLVGRNVEFWILGFVNSDNPNSITLEEIQKEEVNGVIKYKGSTDDVRPFIAAADCIIFPSFYREGISRVLLEGASMAKPIITTDNVGCREVVEEGVTGFLCKPQDAGDLKNTVERFMALSAEERILMGHRGRSRVLEKFDEEDVILHYKATIKRFLKDK